MKFKAIPTRLWGYSFRSKLEAHWAVFFDAMGIKWQYELQGYELPAGRYLPDFFLPEFDLWFEAKGQSRQVKAWQLCQQLSFADRPILLAEGSIGDSPLLLFCFGWGDCPEGSLLSSLIIPAYFGGRRTLIIEPTEQCTWPEDRTGKYLDVDIQHLTPGENGWHCACNAIADARGAKFDRGQSPQRRAR